MDHLHVDFLWHGYLGSLCNRDHKLVVTSTLFHTVVDQIQHGMTVHMMVLTPKEITNVVVTAGGLHLIQVVIQYLLQL